MDPIPSSFRVTLWLSWFQKKVKKGSDESEEEESEEESSSEESEDEEKEKKKIKKDKKKVESKYAYQCVGVYRSI